MRKILDGEIAKIMVTTIVTLGAAAGWRIMKKKEREPHLDVDDEFDREWERYKEPKL